MSDELENLNYLLVLEFSGDDPDNLDRILAIEMKLEEVLESGEVDGNDVGQDVVNIFIITRDPQRCFNDAMRILTDTETIPRAVGYRKAKEKTYTRLWPKDDPSPFRLNG